MSNIEIKVQWLLKSAQWLIDHISFPVIDSFDPVHINDILLYIYRIGSSEF